MHHRFGLLYGWGANESGQLGTGDAVDRTTPSRVTHEEWLGGAAYADTDDEPEKRTLDLQERILGPLHGKLGRFLSLPWFRRRNAPSRNPRNSSSPPR